MIKIKLVVIGGSDAGISASLRAKELSPNTEVTLILADRYPNFSICGLPFYLSGEVSDWNTLAHRTADEIEKSHLTGSRSPRHGDHPGSETHSCHRCGRPQQGFFL